MVTHSQAVTIVTTPEGFYGISTVEHCSSGAAENDQSRFVQETLGVFCSSGGRIYWLAQIFKTG